MENTQIKKGKRFDGATHTVSGAKAKDVKFNDFAKQYLGKVWYPGWAINIGKEEQWISCSWDGNGKCVNQSASKFDLIKP